ncbi:MAG: hypothetical protein GY739_16865 [Mesoflavibacter sp.]|nr:hypothetical protein [Mesoflavibacter sp.]
MKTIKIKTASTQPKETLIFVDKIKYIRERNSNQVYINFDTENGVVVNMSLSEIEKMITEL